VNFPYSPLSSGNQTLQTRARGIHTKPKVGFYRHPLLAPGNQTKVEMGDLLLVYKHYLNGVLDASRASIVQAKYTPGNKRTWKIDTDQFYFMTQWPSFRILGATSKRWHSIRPRALTWGGYGFVGPKATRYPLYYSSARMLRSKTTALGTNSFNFPAVAGIGWDSSTSFLMKFAQGLIGEDLSNTRVKSLVDEIYRHLRLRPDPPGDPPENPESHNERDKQKFAFGIVEFVVTSEERERKC